MKERTNHLIENERTFPTEFSLDEFVSFQLASLVVQTVFDFADNEKVFLSDERHKQLVSPNRQTKAGFLLEFYNGIPHDLWTPLGCWNFAVSGMGWEGKAMEDLSRQLGLRLFRKKTFLKRWECGLGQFTLLGK